MTKRHMLLSAENPAESLLVKVPRDYSERDAIRQVTALIAELQQESGGLSREDLAERLEERGFVLVGFIPGPVLLAG